MGRKHILGRTKHAISGLQGKRVWVHVASLGEFEQARPVMEAIKAQHPDCKIILTFFSPSGYEVRKNFKGADLVCYLPMDVGNTAAKFVEVIDPALVFWVKYDYWYGYLKAINHKKIPLLLISGIFAERQPFFKWYGGLWRKMLKYFTHLFVQTNASQQQLSTLNLKFSVTVAGDTRFDRVIDIAKDAKAIPQNIIDFCQGRQVVVAGSTWPEDELQWTHYIEKHPNTAFIFAPHEVDQTSVADVAVKFEGAVLYSRLSDDQALHQRENVLIIDNIGMLSSLYSLGHICYIGGGFNASGIHNCLEAAVYGKPVIFGPAWQKFAEAEGLLQCGGAFCSSTPVELENIMQELQSDEIYAAASTAAGNYVATHAGATKIIMDYIQEKRLLTS